MYGKKKQRSKQVLHTSEEAKSIAAQKKHIDTMIENVRQYFSKLEQEHKELTTLQAYILAKKLQSEQERKAEVSQMNEPVESFSVNKIKLDLCSKLQGSEEEDEEEESD